ncbi:MAG: hypothetical protein ACXWFF_17805 [Methylomonas sp.]
MNTFARSAIATALLALSAPLYAQTGPVTGAVFTTGPNCQAVNSNIYDLKEYVYLDGGPARPGSAGLLSMTSYYVQVTDPSGAVVLGSSVNNSGLSQTPITTNAAGDVPGCLQLQSIVSLPSHALGFADTPNAGGEYKVWISTDSSFSNQYTKTDNFKVKGPGRPEDPRGTIKIVKFYDTNANGKRDEGEPAIYGWQVDLMGFPVKWTPAEYLNLAVIGGQTYTAREYQPVQSNWYATTPMPISTSPSYLNQATVALDPDHRYQTVEFGNVCTGAGGGLTIGFWSNKNGLAAMKAPNSVNILAGLRALKLVDAQGKDFDPWQYDDQIRTWLLGATAQNMAYMLSAQLAAMYLNVNANPGTHVDPNAMIYAAGVPGANVAGFASVGTVMAAAQASLLKSPYTPAGSIYRAEQESIKNALDMANNNRTFVMPSQCTFSFAPLM